MAALTLEKLSEYYNILQRLSKAEELVESLRSAALPGAQNLTGMPHNPGVRDKLGNLAAEIADMERSIERLQREAAEARREVEAYIAGIDDDYTRLIFRLRFLHGLSWGEVAGIVGGRNTETGIKSICYRYLKSCNAVQRDAT